MQNSTIEAYLRVFVNFKQNDWVRLFLIVEFAYNNTKNASTGHIPFDLNCGYHSWISYKKKCWSWLSVKISEQASNQAQRADDCLQEELPIYTSASKMISQ